MANDPMPGPPVPLPGGIVKNSEGIYAELGGRAAVPLEDIEKLWKVYTRTAKKVKDPTSRRLEAFWWHVWGSDRRYLSGPILAKIFEDISTGPTFVPLGDEDAPVLHPEPHPKSTPLTARDQAPHFGRAEPPHTQRKNGPQRPSDQARDDDEDSGSTGPKEERTSSSAKPPPSHSILKKPRGPSTSGPRPTARFISPDHSDDEGGMEGEVESSGSATATTVAADSSDISASKPERKSAAGTKKFVAGSKRRPVLGRRPSSHSSPGSEVGSRDTMSSSGSRFSAGRNVPSIAEHVSGTAVQTSGSSDSPNTTERQPLSAKSAGKRPAARSAERRSSKPGASAGEGQGRPLVVQRQVAAVPHTRSLEDVRRNLQAHQPSRTRNDLLRSAQGERGQPPSFAENLTPRGTRVQPPVEPARSRELSLGRPPPQGLLSTSVAATSTVAAKGMFDSENLDPSSFGASAPIDSPLPGIVSRPSTSSLLEPHFTPTPPSSTPPVPFGRSKSQLTLLLEREKARTGDAKRSAKDQKEDARP